MKTLIGLLLTLYCLALLVLVAGLSHYSLTPTTAPELMAAAPDFKAISDKKQRKQAFFAYLRPMIAEQNRQLLKQRAQVQAAQEKVARGQRLSAREQQSLIALAERFAVDDRDLEPMLNKLLLRVNIIPEAMALAQAAAESAWGRSRFARQGHNYFGQWCYEPGCGLVPKERLEGSFHEVAQFDSAYHSVQAYFMNINTHRAYRKFRALRAQFTQEGQPLTASALIHGLGSYSERGHDYVKELHRLIRQNNLESDDPGQ